MIDAASATWRVCLCRKETGIENRLVSVTANGQTTTFVYDGDGRRVKKTDAGGTTFYPSEHYEVKGGVVTKYYYLGGQRVAMKVGSTVYWLHGDHLGSASPTTNSSGGIYAQQRYTPYGEVRWQSGTLPTDLQFTGQRRETALGIYDYKARFYSPYLSTLRLGGKTLFFGGLVTHTGQWRGDPDSLSDRLLEVILCKGAGASPAPDNLRPEYYGRDPNVSDSLTCAPLRNTVTWICCPTRVWNTR